MTTLDHLASLLLTRLAWTSLQAILLVGIVALLLRLLPRLPAAARCTLWWLVGLQVLLGLGWHAPIRLPLLAPTTAVTTSPVAAPDRIATPNTKAWRVVPATSSAVPATTTTAVSINSPATSSTAATTWLSAHWHVLLVVLWLCLLLVQLPSLIRQHRRAHRLRRAAQPLTIPALLTQCTRQAHAFGLRRAPALLATPDIAGCGARSCCGPPGMH